MVKLNSQMDLYQMITFQFYLYHHCNYRATEECQTFLTEEANKDKSLDDDGVIFDPLDDSLLLVKVCFPYRFIMMICKLYNCKLYIHDISTLLHSFLNSGKCG